MTRLLPDVLSLAFALAASTPAPEVDTPPARPGIFSLVPASTQTTAPEPAPSRLPPPPVTTPPPAAPPPRTPPDPDLDALLERVEGLERRISELEHQPVRAAPAAPAPVGRDCCEGCRGGCRGKVMASPQAQAPAPVQAPVQAPAPAPVQYQTAAPVWYYAPAYSGYGYGAGSCPTGACAAPARRGLFGRVMGR